MVLVETELECGMVHGLDGGLPRMVARGSILVPSPRAGYGAAALTDQV